MHEESFWANPRTWVGLAFILFFVFFGKVLWKALSKMLDDHTAAVRAELEEASRLRREAEAMLADATRRREAATKEAKALIEGAQAQAERVAAATAAEAEAAAARRERMAPSCRPLCARPEARPASPRRRSREFEASRELEARRGPDAFFRRQCARRDGIYLWLPACGLEFFSARPRQSRSSATKGTRTVSKAS